MRRWRIVHVVRSDAFAGTERYICTVAVAQARQGNHVVVIGGDPVRMRSYLDPAGVVHRPATTVAGATSQLLRCGRCDVVHTHLTAAEMAGALAKRRLRASLVTTRHIAAVRGRTVPARLVGRYVARRVDLQIAISDFVADRVEGDSIVLHDPVTNSSEGQRSEQVVLVAQRLEPEKDTCSAVRAFAASGLASKGWILDIAGDGSDRRSVESTVSSLGLDGAVRLLGRVDDLDDRRRSAAVFLATARAEPFGLSVVEAMASGVPVVATAAGGHIETVGAVAPELLFPPGDVNGAGRLLRRLAEDPPHAAHLGRRLRDHQQRHLSVGAHLDGLSAAYAQAADARGKGHTRPLKRTSSD